MATRSHMDITTPPLPQVCAVKVIKEFFFLNIYIYNKIFFQVSAEVLRVAEHRHRRGLMYPQIYHILTKVQKNPLFPIFAILDAYLF